MSSIPNSRYDFAAICASSNLSKEEIAAAARIVDILEALDHIGQLRVLHTISVFLGVEP